MVFLAGREKGGVTRKQQIAEAEGISPDYVEQILIRLKAAGLVQSTRGRHGGFALSGDANDITVADVLAAVEGPLSLVPCVEEACQRLTECVTRPVWQEATAALEQVFSSATIGRLAAEANVAQASGALSFDI